MVVQGASQGKADGGSPYIWEPKEDKVWEFPEAGSKEGSGAVGGRKRKRTVARDIGRKKRGPRLPPKSPSLGDKDGEEQEEERAKDKRKRTADVWWHPDPWDTNRISRQIGKVSLQYMGERLGIMSWRHSIKAIYRRYIRNQAVIEMIDNADTAEGEDEDRDRAGKVVGDAFHEQSGHEARIGEGIYGRSMNESLFSIEARRIGFRRVSREWHGFCMFDSVLQEDRDGSGTKVSGLADVTRQAMEEEDRRWKRMRQVDVGVQLQKMLGPSARFRGV